MRITLLIIPWVLGACSPTHRLPGSARAGSATTVVDGSPPVTARDSEVVAIEQHPPAYQMRSALRALASAEDEFFKRHGRLTSDVDSLRQMPTCAISRHVEVSVVHLSAGGWASRSRHPALPGRSCVQWVSRPGDVPVPTTDRERRRGDTQPGAVVCDSLP